MPDPEAPTDCETAGRVRRFGSVNAPEPLEDPPFVTRHRVRSYELDIMGHVNNAAYLNWLEQARLEAFESLGYPLEDLIARRWMTTVARIEIDYRREARFGDEIAITTRLDRIGESSLALAHRLVRAGPGAGLVAEARAVLVWLGEDRRPARVPDEVRRAIAEASPGGGGPSGPSGGVPGGQAGRGEA